MADKIDLFRTGSGFADTEIDLSFSFLLGNLSVNSGDLSRGGENLDIICSSIRSAIYSTAVIESNRLHGEDLSAVERQLHYAGWRIGNIALTIIANFDTAFIDSGAIIKTVSKMLFINQEQFSIEMVRAAARKPEIFGKIMEAHASILIIQRT